MSDTEKSDDGPASLDAASSTLGDRASRTPSDPLDLGLGDQGLAELFGSEPDDSGMLGDALDPAFAGSDARDADPIFKDLDFGAVDLPGLAEPTPSAAAPNLTDHLTPRSPSPAASQAVQDDDLLSAMDALALDEPKRGAPVNTTPPPPFGRETDILRAAPSETDDLQADFQAVGAPNDAFDVPPEPASERAGGPARAVLMGLAVIAIVGLGGVIAYGFFGGSNAQNAPPQLIAAPDDEIKIEPEASEDTQNRPGDAVFATLEDNADQTSPSPRVILPQTTAAPLTLSSDERLPTTQIAPAAPGSTASRAVRTVTVRADGTVVESSSQPVAEAPSVSAPAVETTLPSVRTVDTVAIGAGAETAPGQSVATVEIDTPTSSNDPNPATAAQLAAQQALDQATQAVRSALPPDPVARPGAAIAPTAQPVAQPSAPATTPSANSPIQLTAPASAPAQPTIAPTPAPTQTVEVAAAPQPATVASLTPSGEYIVQLASLRTEQEARDTFNRLQTRFGSILGGFQPNIQRADLGERGVFHRVRIGPMERASADSLCQRYQAAGGDCFVQRQ